MDDKAGKAPACECCQCSGCVANRAALSAPCPYDSLRAKVETARAIAEQARLGNRDLRGALEAIDAALREDPCA